MALTIDELEKGYRYWREQVNKGKDERDGTIFGYKLDDNAFDVWLRELCESFLALSDDDRKRLAELVCDPHVLWLLNGYPLLLGKEIKTSADEDKVMLGLVSSLIVDGRVELRERDYSVRQLFCAAKAAGIDVNNTIREARKIAVSDASRQWLDKWTDWEPPVLKKPLFRVDEEIAKSAQEHANGVPIYHYQAGDGTAVGPLTARALRECRYRGVITAQTMIREVSNPNASWKPASEFPEIVPRARK